MTAVLFVQPLRKNRPPERSREETAFHPLHFQMRRATKLVHGILHQKAKKSAVIISYLERRPSGLEIPQRVLLMRP